MKTSLLLRITLAAAFAAFLSTAWANGTLQGHARYHKITGRDAGWNELYEYYVNVCPEGDGTGQRYRAGINVGDGSFQFTLPSGRYAILSSQPKFAWRGTVVPGIRVRDSQVAVRDAVTPHDYSVAFGGNSAEWGGSPWTWGTTFAQTFVATGTSITRASFKLAGKDDGGFDIIVSIRDGGPTGPQIGPERRVGAGVGGDAPVAWRSGHVPTVPGQTYAIRFTASGGQGFAFYRRTDAGDGYAQGTAYVGGAAVGADLYACIGSDSDGTVIPYCKISGLGNLPMVSGEWWANAWGQTFVATGSSLAAADCFVANNDTYVHITWEIRRGGPTGPVIGPVKANQAQYQASGVQHAGVVYAAGEVPLIPGEAYCIRATSAQGMHFLVFEPGDAYADGQAYKDDVADPTRDLYLTIYEYAASTNPGTLEGTVTDHNGDTVAGAAVTLQPGGQNAQTNASGFYRMDPVQPGTYEVSVVRAGYNPVGRPGIVVSEGATTVEDFVLDPVAFPLPFQLTNPSFETGDLTGWTVYDNVDGVQGPDPFFGGVTAQDGSYLLGSAANWGTKSGGVWQTAGLIPGYQYRLSAWYYLNWDGKTEANRKPDVRIGVDPTGGTSTVAAGVLFSDWGTAGYAWTPILLEFPFTNDTATVFLEMRQRDPMGWNITCFDNAVLQAIAFVDRDGDGIHDLYEDDHPAVLDADNPDDAAEDGDLDGLSNYGEYRAGTNPEDPGSVFEIIRIERTGPDILLEWTGIPPFDVWGAGDVLGDWQTLADGHDANSYTTTVVGADAWFRVEPDRD